MVEVGRELFGVALGVLLGDIASTPTRDFLVEERGVMLVLKKGFAGVVVSTLAVLALGVVPLLVRVVRALTVLLAGAAEGVAASRGVRGVFAVRLLASVGFSGRGVFGLVRSMGILLCVTVYGRCGGGERYAWPCGGQWRGRWWQAVCVDDVVV